MFDLDSFIAACRLALDEENPQRVVADLLKQAVSDPHALASALPVSNEDEILLYADDRLVVVHVQVSPNVHFPPHNHHMPVLVGLYRGQEANLSYEGDGGALPRPAEETLFAAPAVYTLDRDSIHSVANPGESRSGALHVYLGNLIAQQRSIWCLQTGERHSYSDARYFGLAAPWRNSLPFERPETPSVHCASAVAKLIDRVQTP